MYEKLKPLPYAPTKKKIYEMYRHLGEHFLRHQMKHIIMESRKKQLDPNNKLKVIMCQQLTNKEFMELIDILGLPKGYKYPDN